MKRQKPKLKRLEKMKNKTLMILGASILQLPAILKAKEMGLEVVVLDYNPDAIGFKEEGIIKEVISTIDIPAVVECAKKYNVDGVMTLASDMPMRAVAAVCKELNLPGIDINGESCEEDYEFIKFIESPKYVLPV